MIKLFCSLPSLANGEAGSVSSRGISLCLAHGAENHFVVTALCFLEDSGALWLGMLTPAFWVVIKAFPKLQGAKSN